jgi:hypothetical protein
MIGVSENDRRCGAGQHSASNSRWSDKTGHRRDRGRGVRDARQPTLAATKMSVAPTATIIGANNIVKSPSPLSRTISTGLI